MSKKKCPECPAGEKWAVPYADFLSLLLALFIALYAISASNTEKARALKEEFIRIFDYAPRPEQAQPVLPLAPEVKDNSESKNDQQTKSHEEEQKTQTSTAETIQRGGILEQVEEGIILKLPTNILFAQDSPKLEDQDLELFLKRIVEIIQKLPESTKIDIRGFANSAKAKELGFGNNYNLAAIRAMYIMDIILKNGVSPERVFFSSQGEYAKTEAIINQQERIKQSNKVEIYFLVSEEESQKVKRLLQTNG